MSAQNTPGQHTPNLLADKRSIFGDQAECARCGENIPGKPNHFAFCGDCDTEVCDE
jgi:hypothetical protein